MRDFSLTRGPGRPVVRTQLVKMKHKAIRAGIWFRALPRIDRVLIDLTIKVTQSIRSTTLAISIITIAKKLEPLFESELTRTIRDVGFSLSSKISLIAQSWGNKAAEAWADNANFAKYLAVMNLNGRMVS